jgi:RNA polymerase sigma-32 factor
MDLRNGLADYVAAVRRIPVLTPEEETAYARAWRDREDPEAARKLVESHLRLVVRVAYSLRGYGVPLSDLIAEGNVGLVQALRRFDPERGLRFATYAIWWVRAAMLEAAMQQATPVKVALTAERKKIFFKLRSLTGKLKPGGGWLSDLEAAEIARDLKVRPDHVSEMEALLAPDLSLDAPREPGGSGATWQETLTDDAPSPEMRYAEKEEQDQRRAMLADAWKQLTDREQRIVADRCLREKPLRLEDLALRYGISRERVRQIEAAAIKKLRRLMGGLAPQGA